MFRTRNKCKATISFRQDMTGRVYVFQCQHKAKHTGHHRNKGDMGLGIIKMPYTINWEGSDAELRKEQPGIT